MLIDRLTAGKRPAEIIDDSVSIQGETKLADRKEQYDEISDPDNKVIIATYGVQRW